MQWNRWTVALCAAGMLCAAPAFGFTGAPFTIGDIFVSDFGANHVQEFSPSGTLIRAYSGSATATLGTVITPDNKLFVANRNSSASQHTGVVTVYTPDGTQISSFNIPQVSYADDIALFPDGTLAITDIGDSSIQEYTQSGSYVRAIPVPGDDHTADAITGIDGSLWVTAETSKAMYNFSETGTLLHSFNTPFEPRDVKVAHDGTLWIGAFFNSNIYHYTPGGQLLSTIGTGLSFTAPLALSPDESSLYVSFENSTSIAHYTTSGQLLGSFTVPGATDLEYITVATPEPTTLSLVVGIALLGGRQTRCTTKAHL